MEENKFEMVAKTFQGLEDVLRDELISIGAQNVEIGNRMVTFEGNLEILYKANLCCRTALRILKPIVKFTAEDPEELYDYVRDLDWSQFMDENTTFTIDSTVYGEDFNHSKYVTYKVKDGIVDHFRDKNGNRPSIRLSGADIQLNVHISGNRVTISLDSSGEPLYKRGYRVDQTAAPINEVLAAGIILKTGWRGDSDFLDPMCGSGTFLIEAALIAQNINPGIFRQGFAFEKWKDFDKELFEEIYNDDSQERDFNYRIFGGDIDPEAIAISRKNVHSAHLDDVVELACQPLTEWAADTAEGIIVTNPPYGERLRPDNLNNLYKEIGTTLKTKFPGWHAWIIGYQDDQMKEIGLKPSVKIPLHNGSLECSLREYVMFDGKYSEFRAEGGSVQSVASDKKANEKPRKMRRISDDDWEKESRNFNRGKGGFSPKKNRDKDRFKEGDRRGKERKDKKGFSRFEDEERAPRFNRDRDFRSKDRQERRGGEKREFRSEQREFRPDRFSDRKERGKSERDFKGNRNFAPGRRENPKRENRGPGVTYNPANSKGPRLPQSSETVFSNVHLRKRKKKENPAETED